MDEIILKDYGWCRIFKKGENYFISFDEGQIVIKMKCYQISQKDALAATENEIVAEKVARMIQEKNKLS